SRAAVMREMRAAQAARAAPSGPPPKPVVTLDGPNQVKVGDEFSVTVRLGTDRGIEHLHGQMRFDPTALQLISATTGDIVPASAGSPKVDARSGGAQIDVRASEDPITGEGSLMLLRFKALAPRGASDVVAQVSAVGAGGLLTANAAAAPLKLTIEAP
ncbi:MAG: hypothetical protein KGL92_16345, partial [Gammaproteobacteria bacterium]|nr:hypothetical protein [Gammaproteobacteria bacterium]